MDIVFAPEQQASVTVLNANREHPVPAQVLSIAGRRMSLRCSFSGSGGLPVRVDLDRYLVLAEIEEVQQQQGVLALRIRHSFHLPEVEEIRRKWL